MARSEPAYSRAAVVATRSDGTVIHWSSGAERLYGWSAEQALWRNISDLTPTPQTRDRSLEIMTCLQAGIPWVGEIVLQRRNRLPLLAFVMSYPAGDIAHGQGAIIGVSVPAAQKDLILRHARKIARDLYDALQRDQAGSGTFPSRTPQPLDRWVTPRGHSRPGRYAPMGPTMRLASLHRRQPEPTSASWRLMQRIETYRYRAEQLLSEPRRGRLGSRYLALMWLRLADELHLRSAGAGG
ncbi:MAG TPA: PAS domain-containing protein [Phenylobacterium sp.]